MVDLPFFLGHGQDLLGPHRKKWPNRRVPLQENWKLWRYALRRAFYGASGLHPLPLGTPLAPPFHHELFRSQPSDTVQSILFHLKAEYKALLGDIELLDPQVSHMVSLLRSNSLYCGSDGSEKAGLGSHAYGFTSGKVIGRMWGRAAMTPGNSSEMSSLRCEHAGAMAILLVLYTFQVYLGEDTVQDMDVSIWLDNAEVLHRAQRSSRCEKTKDVLVLDFDLWAEMEALAGRLKFNIHWEKVDSHIHTRTYAPGVKPKGDK